MEIIVRKLYKLNEEELEVLKRQMKNLGYSYRSLAKKINICPSYVYDLLSGKRMFNVNTREKFEEAGIYFRGGLL